MEGHPDERPPLFQTTFSDTFLFIWTHDHGLPSFQTTFSYTFLYICSYKLTHDQGPPSSKTIFSGMFDFVCLCKWNHDPGPSLFSNHLCLSFRVVFIDLDFLSYEMVSLLNCESIWNPSCISLAKTWVFMQDQISCSWFNTKDIVYLHHSDLCFFFY